MINLEIMISASLKLIQNLIKEIQAKETEVHNNRIYTESDKTDSVTELNSLKSFAFI